MTNVIAAKVHVDGTQEKKGENWFQGEFVDWGPKPDFEGEGILLRNPNNCDECATLRGDGGLHHFW